MCCGEILPRGIVFTSIRVVLVEEETDVEEVETLVELVEVVVMVKEVLVDDDVEDVDREVEVDKLVDVLLVEKLVEVD
jgi:hypothetical protein